jgi:hypothetical protein
MDRGQSGSSGKRGSGSCEWDLPRPLVVGRGRGKGSKVVSDKWASHLSWIWVVRELGKGEGGRGRRDERIGVSWWENGAPDGNTLYDWRYRTFT